MSTTGRLSIELLEAFVAVAKSGNITQAGKELNRTQPCISTQIKRLEERVGKPLLERNARTMGLTQAGHVLLENAENILKSYEIARLQLSAPELTGRVRVGLPEWFTTESLQSIFYNFMIAHPNVTLDLMIADSATLHTQLDSNLIDIAIALPPQDGELSEHRVDEPLVWVTETCDPATNPVPLVLFHEPCPFRNMIFESLSGSGRYWQERMTTSSVRAAQLAISAGVGITALPAGAVLDSFRVLEPSDGFPSLEPLKMAVYTPESRQSDTIDFLTEHLKSFLSKSINSSSLMVGSKRSILKAV